MWCLLIDFRTSCPISSRRLCVSCGLQQLIKHSQGYRQCNCLLSFSLCCSSSSGLVSSASLPAESNQSVVAIADLGLESLWSNLESRVVTRGCALGCCACLKLCLCRHALPVRMMELNIRSILLHRVRYYVTRVHRYNSLDKGGLTSRDLSCAFVGKLIILCFTGVRTRYDEHQCIRRRRSFWLLRNTCCYFADETFLPHPEIAWGADSSSIKKSNQLLVQHKWGYSVTSDVNLTLRASGCRRVERLVMERESCKFSRLNDGETGGTPSTSRPLHGMFASDFNYQSS